MKRETIVPLISGLVLGLLIMIFFNFTKTLMDNSNRISQLEQATASNSKNISDIVTFLNNATKGSTAAGANGAATTGTGTATPTK
jgi:uncharacterized membrane protein YvbJ